MHVACQIETEDTQGILVYLGRVIVIPVTFIFQPDSGNSPNKMFILF